jgi:hypothetical protein
VKAARAATERPCPGQRARKVGLHRFLLAR